MLKFLTWQNVRWILPFIAMGLLTIVAFAQDDTSNVLTPDVPVTGNIDASNVAQVFTFEAVAGDAVTLTVTGQAGFPLSIVMTDSQGRVVGQAVDSLGNGQVDLSTVPISVDGTYFATVFVTAGVDGAVITGAFTITLSTQDASTVAPTAVATEVVEATEAPTEEAIVEPEATEVVVEPVATPEGVIQPADFSIGQVLTSSGIQVNLNWDSPDDLNLQVRDPIGETLYWDSRTSANGGTFGFDVNGLCEVTSSTGNTETASWPGGPVSSGSYEILIYYRQSCENVNPVDFSVDVTVDGVTLDTIVGTLFPPDPGQDSVFISSFTVNQDATAVVGNSGPYTGTRVLPVPVQEILDAPAFALSLDTPTEGVIAGDQYFQTYQYSGLAGELVSVSLQTQIGSLDTLLLMFDSAGNIVASNDDTQQSVITNSLIASFLLPATDTYTIYATRYGKDVGGTEGIYVLTISGQAVAGTLPQSVIDLGLAAGDIQVILTWNSNADLRLLVRDPQLNSIYNDALTSPTGGQLNLQGNVNCNIAATTFPASYIYWPQGFLLIGSYEIDVWHRSECNDFRPVTYNLYVTVRGQLILQESGLIEFGDRVITNFTVQDLQGTAVRGESGVLGGSETIIGSVPYNTALETPITIAELQAVGGEINVANPFDVYVFDGRAGDIVSIDMQTTGTLDTQLFLISPLGQELAANDDASEGTTNSLISDVLLTQDGTYVVIATRFGAIYGGTSGTYNLTLRVE